MTAVTCLPRDGVRLPRDGFVSRRVPATAGICAFLIYGQGDFRTNTERFRKGLMCFPHKRMSAERRTSLTRARRTFLRLLTWPSVSFWLCVRIQDDYYIGQMRLYIENVHNNVNTVRPPKGPKVFSSQEDVRQKEDESYEGQEQLPTATVPALGIFGDLVHLLQGQGSDRGSVSPLQSDPPWRISHAFCDYIIRWRGCNKQSTIPVSAALRNPHKHGCHPTGHEDPRQVSVNQRDQGHPRD